MILVVGATGLLGSRICRSLVTRGQKVRALVRDDSQGAEALRALGIETMPGDLKDPTSLDRACHGVDAVMTTANAIAARRRGDHLISVERDGQLALVRRASAAGVGRFVYVSISPLAPADNLFVQCKRDVERAVRTSGMDWAILQPSAFMDVHLGPLLGWNFANGRGRILGSPRIVRSYVSADDVAEFAVRSLEMKSAPNRDLHVTGPERLTAADAVAIATRTTGRAFKVQRIPTPVLRSLSVLLRRFAPAQSSLMAMAASRVPEIADMTTVAQEFGIILKPFEDYVRERFEQESGRIAGR